MSQSKKVSTITSIDDVSSEWLTSKLKIPIEVFTSQRIGTGQVSWTYRLDLTTSANLKSVVLKVASTDPDSRNAGLSLGLYEKEVSFYETIAPNITSLGSLAKCFHSSFDPRSGTFALLLEDAEADTGNDITGATIEQARIAVVELGKIHGSVLSRKSLLKQEWISKQSRVSQLMMENWLAGFTERYQDRLSPSALDVCRKFVASFDARAEQQGASGDQVGLVHGDYRLDNLLFANNGQMKVVDWQTVFTGPAMTDFAYFVGGSLNIEDRRKYLEELFELYFAALGEGTGMTKDLAREGLRQETFFGVLMCIASPMLVERTARGDEMFMAMMERHCAAVLDLDALATLPVPKSQAPLLAKAKDEYPHSPGNEELWNESWYFDFVDEESGIGAYVRLGRYPNLKCSWYTAVITHPEKGLLAVTDYECPHPGDDLAVTAQRFKATHDVVVPLKEYRLTLKGSAERFPDAASVLRSEKGVATEVTLDLVWHTDGIPYPWKMTTRYEIPCRVRGTVTVDGEEIVIRDAVAQRDHSYGVRDWWAADWMWMAFHLRDGTRIHGADLRIPQLGRISVGYIQGPDLPLTELSKCHSDEKMQADGLPASAVVTLEYGERQQLAIEVKPVGHGPLRLVAPDGRVDHFTRCWAEVKCNDGRTGVGWIEWNHNQKTE